MQNCPFPVRPYDQSKLIKNANLININYTNQDFWSMKSRLLDFVKERFSDTFNDIIESDLAIMLIENWAFIADTLSFKIDQIANEIYIDTVSEVDNAFRLCLLVGFEPTPPIAARSMWSATITNILATDLSIPTPIGVSYQSELGGRTIELFPADQNNNPLFDQDIVIPAGAIFNTNIIGLEGETRDQTEAGSGAINQSFKLGFGPVIKGSVRVYVDGLQWQEVNYFTDAQSNKEYRIEYDPDYNAFIIFGNNKGGLIPSKGSDIRVVYRVGGGVVGNIVTGGIETQINALVPGFGFRVPVTFSNYTKGEFGYDGDSITDIKRKLPIYLRTQDRAVTGEDYQTICDQFTTLYHGSVGKSTVVLRNYGCAANIIDIYILAKNGVDGLDYASNDLKVDLKERLDKVKMFTDFACIKDGQVKYVNVNVDVILDKFYKKFQDEYNIKINRRITSYFDLNNWDYGQVLKATDIIQILGDIKELRSINVNFLTSDSSETDIVSTNFYEIIRPQDIEINFIYE